MAANFEFIKSGLSVEFQNRTTTNPDSYLWDFGDGNNSVEENPTHEFGETGLYLVRLTAITSIGNTVKQRYVGVNENAELPILDFSLVNILNLYLPEALNPDDYGFNVSLGIQKQQLFLQPLVNREIPINKVFNQSYYSALENYLIAQLVAREFIISAANKYLVQFNKHTLDQKGETNQELKSVKTGPSEAEWYSSSELWNDIMKENGTLSILTNAICTLAHRLRITFHFCTPLATNTVVPQVSRRPQKKVTSIYDKSRL